jgi:hypothetical protein
MRLVLGLAALIAPVACSSGASGPVDAGEQTTNDGGSGVDSSAMDSAPSDAAGASDGGDTWDSWAQGFFATYCVSCHSASDSTGRDFRSKSIVVANRLVIRCGVATVQDPGWACAPSPVARQFPIGNGPKPTDAERARVVAWITAGCP